MATPEDLIPLIVERPFRPFLIRLKAGDEYVITEPYHAGTGKASSTCTIVPAEGEGFVTLRFEEIAEVIPQD
ncbi:MAG: hypothetical protein AAGJ46_04835 [Planctomycetota bacterium]